MDYSGNDAGWKEMMAEAGMQEGADGARRPGVSPGPTWRAWLLSIVAAIVLSVAATLFLGGSFRLPGASNGAAGEQGAGSGGPCCPPQGDRAR